MHPPEIEAASSICPTTSPASMFTAPKSFTTTPMRAPGVRSRALTRLVLPTPSGPVIATTGTVERAFTLTSVLPR